MNADVRRPFASVSPLARIWQPRGLDWLLQPHDVVDVAPQRPQSAQRGAQRPPQRPMARNEYQQPRPQSAPAARPPQAQARAPEQGQQASSMQSGQGAVPMRPQLRELPPIWAERLAATRRGLIVWTYAQLGQDLLGVQSEGLDVRRTFLGKLLRDLNHPAGTHTFWPVSLPASPSANPATDTPFLPNPDAFWSGMSRLGARAVVALGEDAVQALGLPQPLQFMQHMRYSGAQVLSVWTVDELLVNEGKYKSMLTFVRSFLRPLLAQAYN